MDKRIQVSASKYMKMQKRIKDLEERDIMSFLANQYDDGEVTGKSVDLDKILSYLEHTLDEELNIYVQVDDENMTLTDRVAESADEYIDGGTF